jgi:hypothetical protein
MGLTNLQNTTSLGLANLQNNTNIGFLNMNALLTQQAQQNARLIDSLADAIDETRDDIGSLGKNVGDTVGGLGDSIIYIAIAGAVVAGVILMKDMKNNN